MVKNTIAFHYKVIEEKIIYMCCEDYYYPVRKWLQKGIQRVRLFGCFLVLSSGNGYLGIQFCFNIFLILWERVQKLIWCADDVKFLWVVKCEVDGDQL